jgi:hypothetical protein
VVLALGVRAWARVAQGEASQWPVSCPGRVVKGQAVG